MPILDKMTQNNQPEDNGSGGGDDGSPRRKRPQRKIPANFVSARGGQRYSLAALVERIMDQFREENTPDDSKVRAAHTKTERLKLLLPVVDYVLANESIALDDTTKAQVIEKAYSEIFGYGPLDAFFEDPTVTTIVLEGTEQASVRRGFGEFEVIPPVFEDETHLQTILARLLSHAGAALREDMPLVEVGLRIGDRPVCVNMAAPPVASMLSLDIRVHPLEAPTIAALAAGGVLTEQAASVLRALMASDYGFLVVGQPESGKTMMLSALIAELSTPVEAVCIERAGEMHLPDEITRLVVEWPREIGDDGVTFGEQIQNALQQEKSLLILDEVRADEPHSIAPLLGMEAAPRLIWSFRGPPDSKRLISALGMLARRADVSQGEVLVRNLHERLPFVVSVRRLNGKIELREIGEWYYPADSEYPAYRVLLQTVFGETSLTGEVPSHTLPGLGPDFWQG